MGINAFPAVVIAGFVRVPFQQNRFSSPGFPTKQIFQSRFSNKTNICFSQIYHRTKQNKWNKIVKMVGSNEWMERINQNGRDHGSNATIYLTFANSSGQVLSSIRFTFPESNIWIVNHCGANTSRYQDPCGQCLLDREL